MNLSRMKCALKSTFILQFEKEIQLLYILAYKPTKLWGSAYTRVMPHSYTARVNAAWTISRPLRRRLAVEARAACGGATHRLLLLLLLHTS